MGFNVKYVPVLDKMPCCCYSCDLKSATCNLGWLGLIGNVGSFLRGSIGLAMFEDSKDSLQQGTKGSRIATVASPAIGIILMALLLYGAHTIISENNRTDYVCKSYMEKPLFMLPAVILEMIGIVTLAVVVTLVSIMKFFSSFLIGLVILLVGILIVVLSTFFWVVTYSYYQKLEERQYPFPTASLDNAGKQVTMHIAHE